MKYIFSLLLLVSVSAYAQPGYTTINARYDWLAGRFRSLHVPGYNGTPTLNTGQWVGSGAVAVDTTNNRFYFYSGGLWRQVSGGTANSNLGSGFRFAVPGTNDIKTLSSSYGITLDSVTSGEIGIKPDTLTANIGLATIGDVTRAVAAGGVSSGTVTSITAGSGLTGGTITTSGTIKVDTSIANANSIASNARLQKITDSLLAIANGKIGGSIASNQIAVGSGTNTIGGASTFTWNGSQLMIGSFSVTAGIATTINTGGSYGTATAGTAGNLKWRLFDDNAGSTYGFGISVQKLEYQAGAGAGHYFYNAGTLGAAITPAGTLSVGASGQFQANSSGKITAYAGAAPTNGQLLVGHTSNGTFEKATLTAGSGISITNGAGSITVAADVSPGTYTPTLTNTTNVAASTAFSTNYRRVGDTYYVWGEVSIDATAALTTSEMAISLPISSDISTSRDLAGVATFEDNTAIQIKGDPTNDRAVLRFTPQTATNNTYSFYFTYKYVAP